MARTARGGRLETRSARLRLAPRGKPYWIDSGKPGLHLGYRRAAGKNGTWVVRRYLGEAGHYETKSFGQADDYSDNDSREVLTYYEAMNQIGTAAPPVRHTNPITVREAMENYVGWLTLHRKSGRETGQRLQYYVTSYFGDRALASLTPKDFDEWLRWAMVHKAPGRRTHGKQARKGNGDEISPAERLRRRRSTLNRIINQMKAALNRAFHDGHIGSRDAWIRLQRFRGADSARIGRLTTDEARRLINACDADFRQLVAAALLTGCRYGELTSLRARDFDPQSGTILIADSKSAKPRRVPLTDEGQQFFAALSASKAIDDLLLTKATDAPWGKSEQSRRMRVACTAARINPPINFHALRHTFASLLVEAGTPIAFVAAALGHSDTRMVSKHYQHLATNVLHEAIRAKLPTFGVHIDKSLRKLHP